jgi:hypothetical protein
VESAIDLFSWSGLFWFPWPSLVVLLIFVVRAIHLYQQRAGEETSKR